MEIIICGAGLVGQGIARQMAGEGHSITVVDRSRDLLQELANTLDIRTLTGHGAYPAVLEQAGAKNADYLIAVTNEDEANMLICQMAHSLFNVPSRIARIRNPVYHSGDWPQLFTDNHIPVSVAVSPVIETARAVMRRLSLPGAFETFDFINGKMRLAGIAVQEDCPVVDTPLEQLRGLFPDLRIFFCAIVREGRIFIPSGDEQLLPGDGVYITVDERDINRALGIFGHQEQEARRIIIAGASETSLYVARELRRRHRRFAFKLLEEDRARAAKAAEELKSGLVLSGSPLDPALLREAGVSECETFVALTDDDKTNILSAVMARQEGAARSLCLYNNRFYGPIMRRLNIDAQLSPRAITIATILRHIRRGRITTLHSIHDGAAEAIEVEALPSSHLAGQPLHALNIPEGVMVGAIWRNDEFIIPEPETEIRGGDRVVVFALAEHVQEAEHLFQADIAFF